LAPGNLEDNVREQVEALGTGLHMLQFQSVETGIAAFSDNNQPRPSDVGIRIHIQHKRQDRSVGFSLFANTFFFPQSGTTIPTFYI
jgi:hypothetical protein